MFVIFGLGDNNAEEKQGSRVEHCFHCNNDRVWIASKVTENFSLFFIPIIPYKTTYSYRCPICNHGYKITKEEFDRI